MTRRGPPPWYTRTWLYALWDLARTRWWLWRHPEERRLRAHTVKVGISPAMHLAREASRLGTTTQALKNAGVRVVPTDDGWETEPDAGVVAEVMRDPKPLLREAIDAVRSQRPDLLEPSDG